MDTKRMIALEFLSICKKKLEAAESFEQRVIESKMRIYYLKLAIEYGCTDREMRLALGVTEPHFETLLELADGFARS